MSDYLWDKTGEPDEDVKELEELLGSLAYQPRPLELPEILHGQARLSHSFAWTRVVAIAAALLLMLLAGAALVSMRRQAMVTPEERAVQQPSPQPQIETPQSRAVERPKDDEDVAIGGANDLPEIKRTPRNGSPAIARQVASERGRHQLSKRHRDVTPAPRNAEVAASRKHELTDEQRRAKDQLMLALRVAGANLRYVQEQVHEVGITEKPR